MSDSTPLFENAEERDRAMQLAKDEEPQEFQADLFLALLRDDQILMDGHDLDEAIAETERQSRPASREDDVAAEELLMKLDMEGEDPVVSDAEGDDDDEDGDVVCYGPIDPDAPKAAKQKGSNAELTRSMMARVDRMVQLAEDQERRKEGIEVTNTRVSQGLSYNKGEWSSEELKELYDGVKKFGTSKPALVRMLNHSEYMSKTRSIQDLYDKIDDIRAMNRDHKEAAIRQEKVDAHERGPIKFQDMGQLQFIWSQQLQKLQNSRTFTRRHEYVRDQLQKFFTERLNSTQAVTMIDGVTSGPMRPIRWSRLYRVLRFVFFSSYRTRALPARIGINAMEAAALLLALNDIQKQARDTLTERTRSEYGSLFIKLAQQKYSLFNLDVPITDYTQPFLDPLRLREWRGVQTNEAPEEVETYEQMFPAETTSKGKKRVRIEEEEEDGMGEVDRKRVSRGFVKE